MKKLIVGNWKMNMDLHGAMQLAHDLKAQRLANHAVQHVVCPPFVYLERVLDILKDSPVAVGAQNCAAHDNGAHTGDISASMIKDLGVSYVILGHSERRVNHRERDEIVRQKAAKAHEHGLVAVICVGETATQRAQGQAQDIVAMQLSQSIPPSATYQNTVIAYEPVWAIGTGQTATPEDAGIMHHFIREKLAGHFDEPESCRILYGGSMKAENAAALLSTSHIDGGLIGGASLKAENFLKIQM